jgi:hypothetical protein
MLDRTENRFGLKPGYADSAHWTGQNLAWLIKQKQITPHIPVCDKSTRTDDTFSRADFTFDAEAKRYACPAGKHLIQFRRAYTTPRTGVTAEGTRLYFAGKEDCGVCHLKTPCRPNKMARKIPGNADQDSCDMARAFATTPEFEVACRRRKSLRCCSRISSASCGSGAYDSVVHAVPKNAAAKRKCADALFARSGAVTPTVLGLFQEIGGLRSKAESLVRDRRTDRDATAGLRHQRKFCVGRLNSRCLRDAAIARIHRSDLKLNFRNEFHFSQVLGRDFP